jgi:chromosomal replication initiation ATPase DnaA
MRRVLDGTLRDAVLEDADGFEDAALLHLLNAFAERGGHLLLTARTAPSRWNVRLPDLKSRLRALPAVAIAAPDDSSLAAILVKLFADRQLRVDQSVIDYLCTRIERSFDGARQAVVALDAASLERRREITVALAREVVGGG